jgi:O-antigen/teichoic acid export membrane protein
VIAGGQVLGRGMLAVYTIGIIGTLSRRDYGDVALALALAGIAAALADAGISRLLIRDVARASAPAVVAGELLKLRAACVITVTGAVAAGSALGLLPLPLGLAAAMVGYLGAEALAVGFESAAFGSERPWRFAGVQALGASILLLALIIIISSDAASPALAMAGLMLASVVKLGGHLVLWRADLSGSARRLAELPIRAWAREAAPFLALGALATVYYRLGTVILHGARGPVETAPYAAAVRVVDAIAVAAGVVFATVSPVFSRAHRERPHDVWRLWKRTQLVVASLFIPLASIVVVTADPLASLLFGDRYADSAGAALRLLAPGMALLAFQTVNAAVVLMADASAPVLRLTTVNVALAIAITWVLARTAGAEGAAAAMTVAELLSATTFAALIRRAHRGHDPGLLALPRRGGPLRAPAQSRWR